jgi:CRISPR-associated protein Cmr4
MMNNTKRHLLTLYTRTPLHVGSGTSVDVVDLPITRERITGFPVIPSSSLKGVLLQRAREVWDAPHATGNDLPEQAKILFGAIEETKNASGEKEQKSNAGCAQIMEAKILAFPVRSLAGCFAWLTCPAALQRFQRDTGRKVTILPAVDKDCVVAGADLVVDSQVVLEEYALGLQPDSSGQAAALAGQLVQLTADPLWTGKLAARLAVVHDENFQHFVTTCTEVVARIAINPETRTVKGSSGEGGGALFNQENVPCEAVFYSVLTVFPPRRGTGEKDPAKALAFANAWLEELLPDGKQPDREPPILQIGGDETTGHGLCETKRFLLDPMEVQ